MADQDLLGIAVGLEGILLMGFDPEVSLTLTFFDPRPAIFHLV
jgi:hypothetical protein